MSPGSSSSTSLLDFTSSIYGGAEPTSSALLATSIVFSMVVIVYGMYAVYLVVQHRDGSRDCSSSNSEPCCEDDVVGGSSKTLATITSAYFNLEHVRRVPIGVVVTLFYTVNTFFFWVEMSRTGIAPSVDASMTNATESGLETRDFATSILVDITDDYVFWIHIAYLAVFTIFTLYVQFVMTFEKPTGASHSEVYRTAVTVFIPSAVLFFLEMVRAIVFQCGPIGGAYICGDPSNDGRLALIPVVTIMRSLTSFQLWTKHGTHNKSVGIAAAALLSLVFYGITVCIFNSQIIISHVNHVDSAFFYIAITRAILTEIWVFQFIRVGVENVVHCFRHRDDHEHHAESSTDAASAALTKEAVARMTDTEIARSIVTTTWHVTEYVMLFVLVFALEFVSLIILHTSSHAPGVVDYTSTLVQVTSWVHVSLHAVIIAFITYRFAVSRTFVSVSIARYSSAVVMNVFPWVLVIALAVIGAESDSNEIAIVAINISRFVVLMALMLLRPRYGNTSKTTWLVIAFTLFLWIAVTVITVLIAHSFAETQDNVEMLRYVLTEILLFETLSFVLDRYYESVEYQERRDTILALLPDDRSRRYRLRPASGPIAGWLVATLPMLYAFLSVVIRSGTFSGVLNSVSTQNDFIAPRFTNGLVVGGAIAQIVAAVALTGVAKVASGRLVRGHSPSYIAACLFTSFSAMFSSLDIFFVTGPNFSSNVMAAVLQPMSDIALIGGGLALWSTPQYTEKDLSTDPHRRWRIAAVGAQFFLAFMHCAIGAEAIQHMKSLTGFELFHLLRWATTAFALYELFAYALFQVVPPDELPHHKKRRDSSSNGIVFYVVLLIVVACPIIGAGTRAFYGRGTIHVNDTGSFVATITELLCYSLAIAVIAHRTRQHVATFSEYIRGFGGKYWLQNAGLLCLFLINDGLLWHVSSTIRSSATDLWWIVTCCAETLRILLLMMFFLHFIPHFMHQVRKRFLASAGSILVVLTRLITYGLAIVSFSYQQHPAETAMMALADALITLHVAAISGALFRRVDAVEDSPPQTTGRLSPVSVTSGGHDDDDGRDVPLLPLLLRVPGDHNDEVTPGQSPHTGNGRSLQVEGLNDTITSVTQFGSITHTHVTNATVFTNFSEVPSSVGQLWTHDSLALQPAESPATTSSTTASSSQPASREMDLAVPTTTTTITTAGDGDVVANGSRLNNSTPSLHAQADTAIFVSE